MKKLNLTGTTSETFSIGSGTNLVELRTIQGRLYFRNVNEPFKELLSNDAEIILSPLQWSSGTNYSQGDLVYYNNILFKVITSHLSPSSFLSANNRYRKVSHINGTLTRIDTEAYQTNTTTLTMLSSDFIYIFGSVQGQFNIKLPDPTSISIGSSYLLQNSSEKIISIYTNNDIFVTIINPNETKKIILIDYNEVDTWSSYSYGADLINFARIDSNSVTFATGVNYPFINASGIFIEDRSGKYTFFDKDDSDLNGDIFWTSGGVNYKVVTLSSNVVSGDTSSKFCYFKIEDVLYFRNNTSVEREIIFQNVYKQEI
jgi:hypothetical protein